MMSLFIHFLEVLTFCLVAALFYRLHNTYKQSLLEDRTQQAFPNDRNDSDDGIISAVRTLKRRDPVMELPVMLDQVTDAVNIAQSTVAELEMTLAEMDALEATQTNSNTLPYTDNATVASADGLHPGDITPDDQPASQTPETFSSADDALNDYIGDFFAGTDSNPLSENSETEDCNTAVNGTSVDEALLTADPLGNPLQKSSQVKVNSDSRYAVGS